MLTIRDHILNTTQLQETTPQLYLECRLYSPSGFYYVTQWYIDGTIREFKKPAYKVIVEPLRFW